MGISGYELAIISWASPLLLAIPSLRALAVKNARLFHILSLSGLLAFNVQDPANRLLVATFAVSCGCISVAATMYAERAQSLRLESRIFGWGIGLVMSSIAKFAFKTNNPIWPVMHAGNGGWNKLGLLLAVLAALRAHSRVPTSGGDYFPTSGKKCSPVLAGLGIGGVFFAISSLLTDSSTMIIWVWDGYPVRGPIPAPHGDRKSVV